VNKLTLEHIQALYLKLCTIFGDKFNRNHTAQAFIELWWYTWFEGLAGIDPIHFRNALLDCQENSEWAPALGEFRRYCEKYMGYPTMRQALEAALRRDFYHPVIQKAFSKMNSWELTHGKREDVERDFKAAYQDAMSAIRKEFYDQHAIEHDKKLSQLKDRSHGSEVTRSDTRGSGVRKAEGYLP
jgi:hypothetical protein